MPSFTSDAASFQPRGVAGGGCSYEFSQARKQVLVDLGEVEAGLALHALLESGSDPLLHSGVHIQRHQVKRNVVLLALDRRKPYWPLAVHDAFDNQSEVVRCIALYVVNRGEGTENPAKAGKHVGLDDFGWHRVLDAQNNSCQPAPSCFAASSRVEAVDGFQSLLISSSCWPMFLKSKARPPMWTRLSVICQMWGAISRRSMSNVPPWRSLPNRPKPNLTSSVSAPRSVRMRLSALAIIISPAIMPMTRASMLGGRKS